MIEHWNTKFKNKKYIWGVEGSLLAELVLKELIKIEDKNNLLDIACGYGRDVNFYKTNGIDAKGIDASEEAVRLGIEMWPDINIMRGDVLDEDVYTLKNDVITCNFFIHLLGTEERQKLIKNIYKNLEPNGVAFFTVSTDQDIDYKTGEVVGDHLVKNDRGVTKFFYNRDLVNEEFRLFNTIKIEEFKEKHTHDFEHEHSNFLIICKK